MAAAMNEVFEFVIRDEADLTKDMKGTAQKSSFIDQMANCLCFNVFYPDLKAVGMTQAK